MRNSGCDTPRALNLGIRLYGMSRQLQAPTSLLGGRASIPTEEEIGWTSDTVLTLKTNISLFSATDHLSFNLTEARRVFSFLGRDFDVENVDVPF
jgi:hypothetical protein